MADLEALVASPWWRWMPGMLAVRRTGDPALDFGVRVGGRVWGNDNGRVPDLTDPATIGCLLSLMYEAEPQHVTPNPVSVCLSQFGLTDPRTVDAIVSAILAAPPPGVDRG